MAENSRENEPIYFQTVDIDHESCKSYFWYAQLAKSAYIADQNAYVQIKIQIDLLTQHILQIEMQIDLLTEHTLQNVLLCISNFIFDIDTYHSILALPWYASLAWKKDKRL